MTIHTEPLNKKNWRFTNFPRYRLVRKEALNERV